jgi:hypothetical protein
MQKIKENEIKHVNSTKVSPLCEKNKIKHSALCCIYCGKSYKTRLNLDKHLILCEITHKSTRSCGSKSLNGDDDDDYDDYDDNNINSISSKKLYQIVMQLALKCNRLENKVADLSKYVTKKIQKVDIIEHLNNKSKSTNLPKLLFENITEIITVEQTDVEFLFHNSFMETVNLVLSRSIYNINEQNHQLPIAAFTQKANTIYVYTKNNIHEHNNNLSSQNPSWSIVSRESFIRFLNIIQFKISKAFSEWRKKNAQLLNDNDNHCILYDKTFSKLMEPDFKIEKTFVKFYNNIYKGTITPLEKV